MVGLPSLKTSWAWEEVELLFPKQTKRIEKKRRKEAGKKITGQARQGNDTSQGISRRLPRGRVRSREEEAALGALPYHSSGAKATLCVIIYEAPLALFRASRTGVLIYCATKTSTHTTSGRA